MNHNGEGTLSPVSSGTVYVQSIPTTSVSNLASALVNSSSVTLTWDPLTTDLSQGYSTVTGYQIQMDSGSGFSNLTPIATTNVGYNITGLTPGSSYYF